MSDLKHARVLLQKAEEDLRALENMGDPEDFSAGIFGFHAQQVAEKSLKAWIAFKGREYPLRHDIEELLNVLDNLREPIAPFRGLTRLPPFAVEFRYSGDRRAPVTVDRPATLKGVPSLHETVVKIVG